jgi:hypothetical protein
MLHFDIEPRRGYLYVTVSGEVDLLGAQSAYSNALQAAARARQPRLLLDCTRVTGQFTSSDRMAFGAHVADENRRMLGQFPEEPKVAILSGALLMDPGRLLQTVANNRGARLLASESSQELLSWLTS